MRQPGFGAAIGKIWRRLLLGYSHDTQAFVTFWGVIVSSIVFAGAVSAGLLSQGLSPRDGWCWGALRCTNTYSRWALFSMFIIIVTASIFGGLSLMRQVRRTREVVRTYKLRTRPIPTDLNSLAREVGLERRLIVTDVDEPLVFTCGWLRPQVILSTGTIRLLAQDELKAVLLHERYHVMRRDPLKVLLIQAVRDGFFYIPIFGEIQQWYHAAKELAADEWAVRIMGSETSIASALGVLLHNSEPAVEGAVAGIIGVTGLRIAQLVDDSRRVSYGRWSTRSIGITAVMLGFFLASFLGPCHNNLG